MKKGDENLKKQVQKILNTSEEKRNFLPLFNCKEINIFSEEERKEYLMNIARKYFEIKNKIDSKNDVI